MGIHLHDEDFRRRSRVETAARLPRRLNQRVAVFLSDCRDKVLGAAWYSPTYASGKEGFSVIS